MAVRVRWRPVAAALVAAIAVVATGLVAVPSAHALPNNTITGTVTDGDNDVPAAGLEVRLYREPGRVVVANRTTAADGTYAFAGLDDGSYRLRVADPVSGAFRTEFFADTYAYAQASPVDVAGGATVVRDMTVARPNAVRGTVTDEDTGLPV
ncbi:MAG: carboxypeptidase regulatory-like domain-containing protein, partial [Acidimicrobiales bacterium]|nr:carboxypeptidase regulatory-like domain-containing protein [Acidimicrobiales bacterium]